MMQFRLRVPHALELYQKVPERSIRLWYTFRNLPADAKDVFAAGIEKALLNSLDEIILKIGFEGEEFYVLVKDFDRELLALWDKWCYLYDKGRIDAAEQEYKKVVPILRKYLSPNLRVVKQCA